MTTPNETSAEPRTPLSRERVLRAAVTVADEGGIDSLSMRRLGQELGVEAMSLYNHVANKEDILDGMVDLVVGEIDAPVAGADWKIALRGRILSAREALKRHPWAPGVIESRTTPTPTVLTYMDSMVGILLEGGFSIDLTHHALHAIGSRLLGFTQELFDDSDEANSEATAAQLQQMTEAYPNIAAMLTEISHDEEAILGQGCDDQFEFEFALDLLLEGLERVRDRG